LMAGWLCLGLVLRSGWPCRWCPVKRWAYSQGDGSLDLFQVGCAGAAMVDGGGQRSA
jgi:hypothetical protein